MTQSEALAVKHGAMRKALAKPGADILAALTPESAHLLHMAVGVAGEAGELLDAIKKHSVYGKPIDRENVIEESGDILFYLLGLMDALYITLDQAMQANCDKLGKRYSSGSYSDRQAQERADKA